MLITMFNMLPQLSLISKASFKWGGEMNPNPVASACTVQESFPFVRVRYLDMIIFQTPWSSFPIWFMFWRLPLLLIRAWWQFWERIEKTINSNPAERMEGFVPPLVHFWMRLQVVAKQPYLILQHHSPSIPPTPGEEAACTLVCSDEDGAHCSAPCHFSPGNLKVKIETKRCLPPSRSPTSLSHDLKNKTRSKAALAVSSKLPELLQAACSSTCSKSTCTGSWLRGSARSSQPSWQLHLRHSYKLFQKQFPSRLHFHLGHIDYSKLFLFNIFSSFLFTLDGVKAN